MNKTTLENFFSAKFFKIPKYQRDYAWDLPNIDDLFNDVTESLETKTSHYVGTFILSRKEGETSYNVVDGQQRLTTLTMLVHALVAHLPEAEVEAKIIRRNHFLVADGTPRLTLLGSNEAFFREILAGKALEPDTGSQRRLARAYQHISESVAALAKKDPTQIKRWLACVAELEVMEFVETNDGRAIRIFQTVNDRGRPLSNIEKAKSLLIYYSNRYLDGALDDLVSDEFGKIFRAYDSIKELAKEPGREINWVSQPKFTEDSVMGYHFLAFESDWHDYTATPAYVLNTFLKDSLKQDQADSPAALTTFITDYVTDLRAFFEALNRLVARVGTDASYFKILSTLNLSASLYPLFVRLEMRGWLDTQVPNNPGMTFRDLVETIDMRVYKLRGSTAERDVARIAKWAMTAEPNDIVGPLRSFVSYHAHDGRFREALEDEMYTNKAIRMIFTEYEDYLLAEAKAPARDAAALTTIAAATLSMDHVLAQDAPFEPTSRGFDDQGDYEWWLHRLGNLTLVEEAINSRAKNKAPETKASATNVYVASNLRSVRGLGIEINQKTGLWAKSDIVARTAALVDFVLGRWPLWIWIEG
jgi:hypothetical protein